MVKFEFDVERREWEGKQRDFILTRLTGSFKTIGRDLRYSIINWIVIVNVLLNPGFIV